MPFFLLASHSIVTVTDVRSISFEASDTSARWPTKWRRTRLILSVQLPRICVLRKPRIWLIELNRTVRTFHLSRGESLSVRMSRIWHIGVLRTITASRQKCALAIWTDYRDSGRPRVWLTSNRPVHKGLKTSDWKIFLRRRWKAIIKIVVLCTLSRRSSSRVFSISGPAQYGGTRSTV